MSVWAVGSKDIMYTGFYLRSNFWGGTYTSIYMYICIYTHAWRGAARRDVAQA